MIRPLNKRLVATLVEETTENKVGGLYMAPKEPKRDTYIVISINENEQGIKVGDKVLIDKYDCLEKEMDGKKVYIINCDRVLGIIE